MVPQLSLSGPRIKWYILSSIGIIILSLVVDHYLNKWATLCDLFVHVILIRVITRALTDNMVHAAVAGWSWLNVWLLQTKEEWSRRIVCQILICTTMGSLLDIDHFIQTVTLDIQDAVHLSHRPVLHNTTLILAVTVLIFILVCVISRYRTRPLFYDVPAMFFIACISHQLRDSTRRGLWLPPCGSLPPHRLYLLVLGLLPVVVVALRRRFKLFAPLETVSKHNDHRDLLFAPLETVSKHNDHVLSV